MTRHSSTDFVKEKKKDTETIDKNLVKLIDGNKIIFRRYKLVFIFERNKMVHWKINVSRNIAVSVCVCVPARFALSKHAFAFLTVNDRFRLRDADTSPSDPRNICAVVSRDKRTRLLFRRASQHDATRLALFIFFLFLPHVYAGDPNRRNEKPRAVNARACSSASAPSVRRLANKKYIFRKSLWREEDGVVDNDGHVIRDLCDSM